MNGSLTAEGRRRTNRLPSFADPYADPTHDWDEYSPEELRQLRTNSERNTR